MNWTGGQLHRHSACPGVLSKTRRQNFAKSRKLTTSRASAQPPPFCGFPDELSKDDTEEIAKANQTTEPGEPSSAKNLSNNRLGILKRRLLQQPDWAAVSVARPLEFRFASVKENGQFARRRKLTDPDQKRLSTNGNPTLPKGFKRRLPISEDIGLGHVKIRIDGQLVGSPSDDTRVLSNDNLSSSSMLLNSEPPVLFQPEIQGSSPVPPWKVSSGGLSLQPSHDHAPLRREEPDIPTKTLEAEYSDPAGYDVLRPVASNIDISNGSPYRSRVEIDRGTTIANYPRNTAGSPLPRRRFTIDDQLLEERMRLDTELISPLQLHPRSSCSLRQAASPSPTLFMSGVSFEPIVSSWLPQPKRTSQHSSPLDSRSLSNNQMKLFQPTVDEVPRSSLSNISLEVTENIGCAVSVKIFGQVVQL
ncbi:hypothetical protein N7507_009285 [Penicillium longicatenatum]|nr:hypothetical protein N7507_009285 [Penicillium longicatenatum]